MKGQKLLQMLTTCLMSISGLFCFMATISRAALLPADMILYNGQVITVDKAFSIAQAVAIRDGKFVAVGNNEEVRALAGPDTKMIDLKGRAVTPGIIDPHVHPEGVGGNLVADVQTYDMTSLQQLLERIAAVAAKKKPGEWITTATNWDKPQVGGKYPTLKQLDAVTPNNPLRVARGGHYGWANTLAMKLAGITKDTPNPTGGKIDKDPKTGEPTGLLWEQAQRLVTKLYPPSDSVANLRKAVPFFNSIGVTAIGNDGIALDELEAYHKIKNSGDLTMRVVGMLQINPEMKRDEIFGMINAIAYSGLKGGGLGDDTFKLVGLKTVNESREGLKPLWPRERLQEVELEAAKKEVRFSVHCGCALLEENLGIFQSVNKQFPITRLRWVMLHSHLPFPSMIPIYKSLGLVVHHEPGMHFLGRPPEISFGERPGYTPDRLVHPISEWLKAGVPFSLSTDAGGGAVVLSIWGSIFVSCNRNRWPGWGEKFNVSREEALRAATMGGAYKLGMEEKIGSIEKGKFADLAVLSGNPLTCPDDQIRDINAVMTIVDGKIVYSR
ncbi:MAG: amidohydrolase [Thermodesulfobacteriota bacterium]